VDRFIETHKFQLGPHIAENVVPSLTVTDILACVADLASCELLDFIEATGRDR